MQKKSLNDGQQKVGKIKLISKIMCAWIFGEFRAPDHTAAKAVEKISNLKENLIFIQSTHKFHFHSLSLAKALIY